jgi:hypothetical protein
VNEGQYTFYEGYDNTYTVRWKKHD